MRTVPNRLGVDKTADDFVAGYVRGYNWAEKNASLQKLEMLHKYFIASRGKDTNPCESLDFDRISMDKSIVTLLVRSNGGGNLRDLSPLDPIGFIEGALDWRLRRNRFQRLLLRERKRRETGQEVNLRVRAGAAPCADASCKIACNNDPLKGCFRVQ